ncbi:ribbon-helix-helix domain-containing protein [Sphingomonas cannabina]|uniref:ribbon-helix-helix domain-containing protein n=1 Tax=Sphingomonas cannabina TaxID=2899123 RepID=UPI001F42954C|nr:ribbon-helix-helix domain-containing protein [Sphingomonas cannabina]UIJ47126.1 ribbon-helix-helix domain-containing protein [Sphingomonas cannabina]
MRTAKTRHQFYLPDDLSAKLDALALKPGASKTAILTDALNAWIERAGHNELDERFGPRLDRQSRIADRTEQKLDYLTEALGLFIRHQLTLTAHQPAFDAETNQLGRLRYDEFMKVVGRMHSRGDAASRLTQRQSPKMGMDK